MTEQREGSSITGLKERLQGGTIEDEWTSDVLIFTIAEHKHRGSTPEGEWRGKRITSMDDVDTILDEAVAGDEEAMQFLLTPLYAFPHNSPEIIERMKEKREKEKKKVVPANGIFSSKTILDLDKNGWMPCVKLGDIDEKTGRTKPEWSVRIMNDSNQMNPNVNWYKQLKLDPSVEKYFCLDKKIHRDEQNNPYQMLRLNIPRARNVKAA